MKKLFQLLSATGLAMVVSASSASASMMPTYREGPWCAKYHYGLGEEIEDCSYFSIEECRPHVVSGDRGVCGLNPRWVDVPAPLRRRHKAHR
ncbi:MAG: DUF3551 domain-containing protein [Pseudolabrys sp.]|nr:DUF3551 domain-containing protein [Pseudolabrys sp.]